MLNRVSAKVFLLQVLIILVQTYSFIVCTIHTFSWLHVLFYIVSIAYTVYIADLLYHRMLMQTFAKKSYSLVQSTDQTLIMLIQASCICLIFVFLQLSDYSKWYFYSSIQLLPFLLFLPTMDYDMVMFGDESLYIERVRLPYDHVLDVRLKKGTYHVLLNILTYDRTYTICVKKKHHALIIDEIQKHIAKSVVISS